MPRTTNGDSRQKILDAAEHRLWHYGFKKTTIDEIAADAGVGKGTVYLYFGSKEEIALAIVTQFKELSLNEQQQIVLDRQMSPVEKIKQMLTRPALMAYRRCIQSPSAQEMVSAVRPQLHALVQPYQEQEIALLAAVVEEGIRSSLFAAAEPLQVARTLKNMCAGFWPPYPLGEGEEDIATQISRIVDLAFCGLKNPSGQSERIGVSSQTEARALKFG